MEQRDILLLGDAIIDTIMPISEFPTPGRDGLASTIKVEIGGAVVNSAIVLENLGQSTILMSSIGDDIWADYIMRNLSERNINVIHLIRKTGSTTGLTFIIVTPDGERTMFSHRGANILINANDINENIFRNAGILHISGYGLIQSPQYDAVMQAIQFAKKFNVDISLDTGLEPVLQNPEGLRSLLPLISIFISGPQEVKLLLNSSSPEKAADDLLAFGIKEVAIMMGNRGSLLADREQQYPIPVFPVKTVDSTGAGDSFTAGLLYGWVHKLSLKASATLASVLGALAVTVHGAGFSLPDRRKVKDFLISIKNFSKELFFLQNIEEVMNGLEKNTHG